MGEKEMKTKSPICYGYKGVPLRKPARQVALELNRISKKYGKITRQIVVDESRKKESILHSLFEWNDGKAAEKYRLQQAGVIINKVTVKIVGKNKTEVQAFTPVPIVIKSVKASERKQYLPTTETLSRPDLITQRVNYITNKLLNLRKEYSSLKKFAKVWRAIDDVLVV
jgi:hypothetical protein